MNNEKFDRLLSRIRNDSPDERLVTQAGDRVWKSIAEVARISSPSSPHTWRSNWRPRALYCSKITYIRVSRAVMH
jgi:hypothetical protein